MAVPMLAWLALRLAGVTSLAGADQPIPRGTRDAEAYSLYVKGMAWLRGPAIWDLNKARPYFEEALARDPQFAEAHAGLAEYHFVSAWFLDAVEENVRSGRAAADRAMKLDPGSSEAHLARANFAFWEYRFRGDTKALGQARKDFARAIELDPSNTYAHFSYGRAVAWIEPDLAVRQFERAAEIDPLYDLALARNATLLSIYRGLHEAARERLRDLSARSLADLSVPRRELERNLGHLDQAVGLLRGEGLAGWNLYLSLGDPEAARKALDRYRGDGLKDTLREAALLGMDGRVEEAFETLDRHRDDFPLSRILDAPAARYALIVGRAEHARQILEQRLPDLTRGLDAINGMNVLPALDLAAAYARTGQPEESARLLEKISAFLDGENAPRQPLFLYLRARAHALAGAREPALRELDRAYDEGFRTIWALDVGPAPLLYVDSIDMDPAFAMLRADPRFASWRERIRADNARQLERVKAQEVARTGV